MGIGAQYNKPNDKFFQKNQTTIADRKQIHEDLKGVNYEHIGISPDIQIEYSRLTDEFFEKLITDIKAGTDPAIEAALQRIKNR